MAKEYLKNSYICSADNYFAVNPFEKCVSKSYYATVYAEGNTKEWCVFSDENERIIQVRVGGENAWYMMGHAFFDQEFSCKFRSILEKEYNHPDTVNLFWENIYINHIDELDMWIRKYEDGTIYEFDSLDELREFDRSYIQNTRSSIIEKIAHELNCEQIDISDVFPIKDEEMVIGFRFLCQGTDYQYFYANGILEKVTQ